MRSKAESSYRAPDLCRRARRTGKRRQLVVGTFQQFSTSFGIAAVGLGTATFAGANVGSHRNQTGIGAMPAIS